LRRCEIETRLAHDLSFRVLNPKHDGRLIGVLTHVPTAWISFGHVTPCGLEFEQAVQGNDRISEADILRPLFCCRRNNKKKIGHILAASLHVKAWLIKMKAQRPGNSMAEELVRELSYKEARQLRLV
jgi:hypothetical protein